MEYFLLFDIMLVAMSPTKIYMILKGAPLKVCNRAGNEWHVDYVKENAKSMTHKEFVNKLVLSEFKEALDWYEKGVVIEERDPTDDYCYEG